jgi:hypothetical protein
MTLTELSFYIRKYFFHVVLFFLVILITAYSIRLFSILQSRRSAQTDRINPIFQALPNPLTNIKDTTKGMQFTLDNIDGRPTTATDSAQVFLLLEPPTSKFGADQKALLMAKSLGIDVEAVRPRILGSQSIYTDPTQKLKVDLESFNFTYEYLFEDDPSIFEATTFPTPVEAESRAKSVLTQLDVYPRELAAGQTNVIYFYFDPTSKKVRTIQTDSSAPSQETPNMVEVDFSRPDQGGIPVVSPSYYNTQNYVLLAFYTNNDFKILKAQVQYQERSPDQIGVYPLRTGDEAYADLQKGEGFVVQNPTKLKNVTIKKMFLAYFDSEQTQQYLQPVYVFLGVENNFVAYVPAVSKDYMVDSVAQGQ